MRGSARCRCGASAARQAGRSHSPQCAPAIPASASVCAPVGRARTGTSQASASRQDSPKVSQSDGQTTALAALIQMRDVLGRGAAERQQLGVVAGERARAVDALDPARGVVGEQEVAPRGVQAEALARRLAIQRPEALDVDPARQQRDGAPVAGAGDARGELGRRRPDEVHAPEHGARDPPRARVMEVVAVERHEAVAGADGERRPGREAEVGVDDVEALAGEAPAKVARRRAGSCARRPGRRRRPGRGGRRCAAARAPGRARSCRARGGRGRGTCS